ncbi:Hypothetical predicted protein [Olea europaea subsp. europaea]|uniref:Uncharacterized protein n=1 Tax=Olea europaea subsp. europaea TaxID=158383 RepID=A0A8S0PK62_OLEEU|nr:Hypothetical predicted protein [Olea europaea subsp. europaea]
MQFGDTGDAGTSAHAQSPNRPQLLMITDGCKGHSSDVEDDDDDDDFVDTPPKRKKTHSHFPPPTEEHATREYYPTELEGHDMHISPQPQATHADDELQPADMQFGDTGDAGTSARAQSPNRPQLLMITDGCKWHSSYVEDGDDDDDDDFVDTPPKRKKTHSRFQPPTEEHAMWEYYPTEPEEHDIHSSPQPQAPHADDEPQPTVFQRLKAELREQMSELQCEIRLDMTEIRSSMTFLSDSVTALISSTIDAIVAKATGKSEGHSVGDAPQQEKVTDIQQHIDMKGEGKMDPADEIEYPTPSFDLGVASTQIISNEVGAIIAGVVKDYEIEEQTDVVTKTVNEDQVLHTVT